MTKILLKGMTWNHKRAIKPLVAASSEYESEFPNVEIRWDMRPLQDFESQPVRELANAYDLMIIDHPHLGEAVRENLLVDLSTVGRTDELDSLASQSAGPSHRSYNLDGGQWALAIDAASPVASYRPDLLQFPPSSFNEVIDLARAGKVTMPLRNPHTLIAFLWIARNHGFAIAETQKFFMNRADAITTLERFKSLADHLDPVCQTMDPIAIYDRMSSDSDWAYCPHGYGYISYASDTFRSHTLVFTDVVEVGTLGVSGTLLGGTGIAVSGQSKNIDAALDFAFKVCGAQWQKGLYTANGGQPGNSVAWEDEVCNALCGNFLRNTKKTLDASWIRPRYDAYIPFQTDVSNFIAECLFDGAAIAKTIDRIEARYQVDMLKK